MKTPTVVVLQARMNSARLPNKSTALIKGEPLVAICLRRLLASDVGPVVLATTVGSDDDCLVEMAAGLGVEAVRGSRGDVLSRFQQVVRATGATFIVRATGDNPAIDIDAARRALDTLERWGADCCCERGLPYGTVVEAIRATALIDSAARATTAADREHVTTYVRREVGRYRVAAPDAPSPVRRPDLRLSVDTPDDLAFMRSLAEALPTPLASTPLPTIIAAVDRLQGQEQIA